MIRIYVIEDHATIIVSGFKRMFFPARDGIEFVGSSESVESAIQSAGPQDFDIFILDLWLESKKPVQDIRMLKAAFPDHPIIIFTSEKAIAWKNRMKKEGAKAYLVKNADRNKIKSAILAVADGKTFFSEVERGKDAGNETNDNNQILTPRQQEIITYLRQGKNHEEICESLEISRSTLDDLLKRMRLQFDARNTNELISKFNTLC